MKKFITIVFALLFIGMSQMLAQSFEFQYQGKSLQEGATVNIAAEEDTFGELSCMTNASSNPTNGLILKMLSTGAADLKAELKIEENTWKGVFVQWCMGGSCVPLFSGDYLSKDITITSLEQVQLDASNISSKGHLLAKITVSKSSEKRSVYVKFTYGEDSALRGDLNNDGVVNVADVIELLNIIMSAQ